MHAELLEKIRNIQSRHATPGTLRRDNGSDAVDRIPTRWDAIDAVLQGGLAVGGLHEWIGVDSRAATEMGGRRRGRAEHWSPPLAPLITLAWRTLESRPLPAYTVWIGANTFPYPSSLLRDRGEDRRLLLRSLFICAARPDDRLWAADLALRCPAVSCVALDGSRFDRAATQRLQLLAQSEQTPVLLIRPPWERHELSAAQTRWQVSYEPPPAEVFADAAADSPRAVCPPWPGLSPRVARLLSYSRWPHVAPQSRSVLPAAPRWRLTLLRCKGATLASASHSWVMEWDDAAHLVRVSAEVRGASADAGRTATDATNRETA